MRNIKTHESFLNSFKRESIFQKYKIENYTINPDGSVDVSGYVNLVHKGLEKLPLKFNKVDSFSLSKNNLTSFEGSPVEVNGDFWCYSNKLTSFKFSPKIIRGTFDCEFNNIKTFEYFPIRVGGDFLCQGNPIYQIWNLFEDIFKIELLNDCDIFRDEETDKPSIFIDRLNDFLLTIGEKEVRSINGYKNI